MNTENPREIKTEEELYDIIGNMKLSQMECDFVLFAVHGFDQAIKIKGMIENIKTIICGLIRFASENNFEQFNNLKEAFNKQISHFMNQPEKTLLSNIEKENLH